MGKTVFLPISTFYQLRICSLSGSYLDKLNIFVSQIIQKYLKTLLWALGNCDRHFSLFSNIFVDN